MAPTMTPESEPTPRTRWSITTRPWPLVRDLLRVPWTGDPGKHLFTSSGAPP